MARRLPWLLALTFGLVVGGAVVATFVVVGDLPGAARRERDRGADAPAGLASDSRARTAVLDAAPPGEMETAPRETIRERAVDGRGDATSHARRQTALNSRYRAICDEISRIGSSLPGADPSLASLGLSNAPATEQTAAPARDKDWDARRLSRREPPGAAGARPTQRGPIENATAAEETLNLLRRAILARAARPAALRAAPAAVSGFSALSEDVLAALGCAREWVVERRPGTADQSLRRAVDGLGDLEAELDHDPSDQLAAGLARIYSYCRRLVMEAHLHADPAGLLEAASLLASLRDAWRLAQDQPRSVGP